MATIDLDQLQRMWQEDAKIDDIELDKESVNVPNLHAKYLTILSTAKLNLQKERSDYYKLRRFKWRYYRGELSQQELTELGWDQYLGAKPLKNEMDEQLEGDFDLIKKKDKIAYWETVVDTLERIMRSIGSRGFDIKHAIEWHKFTNGVM
jgi:hypothetical protein